MMKYNDLFNVIELMNKQYSDLYQSEAYVLGKRLIKARDAIKSLDVKSIMEFWKSIQTQKKMAKVSKRIEGSGCFYQGAYDFTSRLAIYTCITNNYDSIKEPLLVMDNEEFFLFSDDVVTQNKGSESVWKRIPINAPFGCNVNRYYKMHPFQFEGDFDYAIYIDGSIQVVSELGSLCQLAREAKTGIAMHRHSRRDCVYEEARACIIHGNGNGSKIKKRVSKYKAEGLPQGFGLFECGIIVVDLKNKNASYLFSEWWKEFQYSQCERDQLSFPYILWKNGYKTEDVGNLGCNLMVNPKIRMPIPGSISHTSFVDKHY